MFLRKYGTGSGADVIIPIIKRGVVDFAVTADWTPASGDVKVSKDGGTEANIATLPVINGTVGWKFVFSDAELQCKSLTVRVVDSATKAIEDQFFIVETFGDASAMFQADLSAANLPANVIQISGDSTAADNLEAAADGTGYNLGAGQIVAASVSGSVGSVSGAVGSVTGNVGGNVTGSTASVVGAVGSVTGSVGSVVGNLGGNVNGNVSGSVASVVGNLGGNVAGNVSGSVGSVAGAVGSVTGSVGSVVGSVGGDVAGKVLGGGSGTISGDGVRAASVTGAVGSVTGSVGSVVGAVELDSAATAALVDLIWDEPLTGATHNVATSSGKRLRQTTAFQQIDSTVIDASATTTTFITGLTSSVDNFYNDSMLVFTDGALAGQVRAIYDYIGATKTIVLEEALTSAPVNGVAFAIVSLHIHPVSQIQNGLALAATALSTTQWSNGLATDLGTTNTTVATNLNATVSSRSTQTSVDTIDDLLDTEIPALTAAVAAEAVKTSAIKAKTDNLPSDPADQSLVEAAITAATSPLATPAQVNAQVLDVLSVDTFGELGSPPAATSSLKDKLVWLFMWARNKSTATATERKLYADDVTTIVSTETITDNGTTFTKGESL